MSHVSVLLNAGITPDDVWTFVEQQTIVTVESVVYEQQDTGVVANITFHFGACDAHTSAQFLSALHLAC